MQVYKFLRYLSECSKDTTKFTLIVLKKKTKTRKSSDHRTICLDAHRAKTVAKILKDD